MKFFETLLAAIKMAPEEARKVLGLDKVDPEGNLEVTGAVTLPSVASQEEAAGEYETFHRGDLYWREEYYGLASVLGSSHGRFRFVTFGNPMDDWDPPMDFLEYVHEVERDLYPYAAYGYKQSGNQTKVKRGPVVGALEVSIADIVGIMHTYPQALLQTKRTNNAFVLAGWGEVQDPPPAIFISRWGVWDGGSCGTGGWGAGFFGDNLQKYHRVSRLFFPDLT